MNNKIISLLLLTIMFLSPFAFANTVCGEEKGDCPNPKDVCIQDAFSGYKCCSCDGYCGDCRGGCDGSCEISGKVCQPEDSGEYKCVNEESVAPETPSVTVLQTLTDTAVGLSNQVSSIPIISDDSKVKYKVIEVNGKRLITKFDETIKIDDTVKGIDFMGNTVPIKIDGPILQALYDSPSVTINPEYMTLIDEKTRMPLTSDSGFQSGYLDTDTDNIVPGANPSIDDETAPEDEKPKVPEEVVETILNTFLDEPIKEFSQFITDTNGVNYLVKSGEIATGETVKVMNIKTGLEKTMTIINPDTAKTAKSIFSDLDVAKEIAKSPEALAALGLKSVKVNGDIITATATDGSIEKIKDGIVTEIIGAPGEATSAIGKLLKVAGGGGWDALFAGAEWGVAVYGGIQMVGPIIGLTQRNTDALSLALSISTGVYRAATVLDATAGTWLASPWTLVGVSAIVFAATYREEGTDVVEFECMPWQAPSGGDDCEICNEGTLPCSEYRCKSLGQNCEIVNAGTTEEKCVSVDRGDVGPPIISPNEEMLSSDYKYDKIVSSPPGPGFEIVNSTGGCLKAFTPLAFGVNTNEPAQCKIDFNHTRTFDEMRAFIGGSNLYLYNHSEEFSLPNVAILEESRVSLENGKDLTFFIRCKDQSGNENVAEYAVRFCVDPTPDSTAPRIEASSVLDGGCIAEGKDSSAVEFYTNEPAECRWSNHDQDYDSMFGTMIRSGMKQLNSMQVYKHIANLTGIGREDTEFYIRCKDQPEKEKEGDRNKMRESFEFSLRGSTGLKTRNLGPSEEIFGVISPMPMELHVETLLGCDNGQAVCYYSKTYDEAGLGYIRFFETSTVDGIHNQRLDLTDGDYKYFVRCVDGGGNLIEDTIEFELDIDPNEPIIARIYEEAETLKLVTVRESDCAYSLDDCDFSFEEGTMMPYDNSKVHLINWDDSKTFYIKCRDEFREAPVECSAIVRPMKNFL